MNNMPDCRYGRNKTWALRTMVTIGALLILLTRLTYGGDSKRIFRFRDAKGVLQIATVLPPEQAQAGYEILDASTLRTLAVVPPTLTDRERVKRDSERRRREAAEIIARAAQQARKHEADMQRQRDQMLLQTYASEDDLIALRDTKLESLRQIEASTNKTVGYLRVNLAQMDAIVAEHQAAGRTLPLPLQAARKQTQADLAEQAREAERLHAEQEATRARFEDDLRRYRELTSGQ